MREGGRRKRERGEGGREEEEREGRAGVGREGRGGEGRGGEGRGGGGERRRKREREGKTDSMAFLPGKMSSASCHRTN